jgi:hypothetical protein
MVKMTTSDENCSYIVSQLSPTICDSSIIKRRSANQEQREVRLVVNQSVTSDLNFCAFSSTLAADSTIPCAEQNAIYPSKCIGAQWNGDLVDHRAESLVHVLAS